METHLTGSDEGLSAGERWLRRGVIGLTLLACAIPFSGNNADADLWGHVQFGRDALRFGLPEFTTYSFTAIGYPWVNHENLAELSFALLADSFGGVGLLIFKCLVGLTIARVAQSPGPSSPKRSVTPSSSR